MKGRLLFETDLHIHTQASGHAQGSTEDYIRQAEKIGLNCLGFTEHVGPVAEGAPLAIYFKTFGIRYPKRVNGVVVLKGAECNIDLNGDIDSNMIDCVKYLDYVIASMHFTMGGIKNFGVEENTKIVINFLQKWGHLIDILGHPWVNYLPIDLKKVIPLAIERGVIIELNLSLIQLNRMSFEKATDLVSITRENKGLLSINTDAHNVHELGVFSKTEIGEWLESQNLVEAQDIVNKWHWSHIENYFKQRKSKK